MNIEVLLLMGGLVLSAATYFVGRYTQARADGVKEGSKLATIETKLDHIAAAVGEIKAGNKRDIEKLENSIQRMHKRLDEHIQELHKR